MEKLLELNLSILMLQIITLFIIILGGAIHVWILKDIVNLLTVNKLLSERLLDKLEKK